MKKLTKRLENGNFIVGCIGLGIISVILCVFINSYSLLEANPSISFSSKDLDYSIQEEGSFEVTKSAKWMDMNKARITFEVDSIAKVNQKKRDIILALGLSDSMNGEKLDVLKEETISLVKSLLMNDSNRVALITYGTEARVISDFINEYSVLESQLNTYLAFPMGKRNHYDALVKVEGLLNHYQKEDDRECSAIFLTDGLADTGTPNELREYAYLKSQYPYLTMKAVQYEMGEEPLPAIQAISDYQYTANVNTLGKVLRKVADTSLLYDKFELTDWISSEHFTIGSVSNIEASLGNVKLTEENGGQKVSWHMDTFQTGTKEILTIDIDLKSAYQKDVGFFATNQKEEVNYKLGNVEERVSSSRTPVLGTHYDVSYDTNAPSGCVIDETPAKQTYHVLNMIKVSDDLPACKGYQFAGWKIVTPNVQQYNNEYFIMPETDVLLRAEWEKMSIAKTVNGAINPKRISILQSVGSETYNQKLWRYKSSISRIVFSDVIASIHSEIETFDISQNGDGSVIARVVANGDGTHTAYIQGDGTIYANPMSAYLFYGFEKLETIENLGILDTSNVTNMTGMFANCPRLTTVDLSHFTTSNVTDMSKMFYNCSNLSSLNLTGFDTSKVSRMNAIFFHCSSLASLDVSSFNTSNVTDMAYMFAQCFSLASLDLSNFDTSKVKNMEGMFYGGYNSELMMLSSLDLSSFNTSNVTNMAFMFGSCGNLTELNINHFDTSKVTDMQLMFYNCTKIKNLDLSNFQTQNVTDMNMMFNGCTSLTSLDIHSFDTSNVTLMQFMFIYCGELTELNVSHFDTSKVTNMGRMFYNCGKIRILDVSGWNTENVTDMSAMFFGCDSLETLDVSNFKTSKVTDMSYMFWHCRNLTVLDVSHFDTSQVTTLSGMFNSCEKVVTLDVSGWNTENVTLMDFLFTYCKSLTALNVSHWNTSKVLSMEYMFTFESENLKTLNVSNFNTSNVLYMNNMFQGTHGLTSLDLSNFDTSKVQRMDYMFESSINLSSITLNFETPSLISAAYLFSNCQRLVSIDLSKMDTSRITDMTNMFANCWSLSTIDIRNAIFDQVTGKDNLISNYQAITRIIVKDENAKIFWQSLLGDKSSVVITASEL